MSEIAKEYGIKVYICSVLPAKDFPWSPNLDPANKVIRLNEILKDYCVKNDIFYVDYYSKMNDGEGGLKVPEYTSENDLVHPNSDGYAVMESIILNAIKKGLLIIEAPFFKIINLMRPSKLTNHNTIEHRLPYLHRQNQMIHK